MSEHEHQSGPTPTGQDPDGPIPAPTGTGQGNGVSDRPIPADHAGGTGGGNTPDDGSAPGDIDADAVEGAAGTHGQTADPRSEDGAEDPADDDEPAASAAADGDAAPADAEADSAPEDEPDWKDRYVRSVAELDNVRKRARRDVAQAESRGVSRLAKELLPALDNLDRALAHVDQEGAAPSGDAQLVEGLRIVHREIHAALSSAGIAAYDPLGEPFDPHAHEALTQQPAPEGTEPGTIIAVYQAGYRRGDDVLRAAKVVVAG